MSSEQPAAGPTPWLDRFLAALAVLGLLLVGANYWWSQQNAELSRTLVSGQQEINEGLRLSRTNTQLVRLIAQVSAGADDEALREMLARHGIRYRLVEDPADGADSGGGDS